MPSRNLHLRLSPELALQFDDLCAETGLTRAAAFHRAIALYARVTTHRHAGGQLLLQHFDGTTTELVDP